MSKGRDAVHYGRRTQPSLLTHKQRTHATDHEPYDWHLVPGAYRRDRPMA